MVLEWFLRVDRQLDNRDVGVGEGMDQNRPGAVVEAPTVVIEPDPGGLGDLGDLFGEGDVTRRRVLHGEEFIGEPVEIVNRLWSVPWR